MSARTPSETERTASGACSTLCAHYFIPSPRDTKRQLLLSSCSFRMNDPRPGKAETCPRSYVEKVLERGSEPGQPCCTLLCDSRLRAREAGEAVPRCVSAPFDQVDLGLQRVDASVDVQTVRHPLGQDFCPASKQRKTQRVPGPSFQYFSHLNCPFSEPLSNASYSLLLTLAAVHNTPFSHAAGKNK